ncbi:hypothetical protein C8A03DRAFT_34865 [Achaetomium macrosporum]|uniref:Uncharacterized protein n=1 Tax=Achaetomium macrosporum TaxID=79813 RepID=A0AAN7H6E3_9PEZI|nr:hypothetical protein C8A03DRAFT_34865 [Achaetomium macrosporum]
MVLEEWEHKVLITSSSYRYPEPWLPGQPSSGIFQQPCKADRGLRRLDGDEIFRCVKEIITVRIALSITMSSSSYLAPGSLTEPRPFAEAPIEEYASWTLETMNMEIRLPDGTVTYPRDTMPAIDIKYIQVKHQKDDAKPLTSITTGLISLLPQLTDQKQTG